MPCAGPTGTAIERASAQATPGAKNPDAQKPETKLSPEERRQLAHQMTLKAWKNFVRLREEYTNLLIKGTGEAKTLKEAEDKKKELEMAATHLDVMLADEAAAGAAPEVSRAWAEFGERSRDLDSAANNETVPDSYVEEAHQRYSEAFKRWREAVNKEAKRIKNDLEAGHAEVKTEVEQPKLPPGQTFGPAPKEEPQSLQARVAALADDQMIRHGNFKGCAHRDDLMGEVDVVGRRLWIAGWMIVHKDDCRSAEFEGAAHDLAGIDRRMIDRADTLNLVGDQMILLVEKISASWGRD